MYQKIRIVRPSSRETPDLLMKRLNSFKNFGLEAFYDETQPDPHWPFTSSCIYVRANALNHSLMEEDTIAVWCARGGYGASDLLDSVLWDKLRQKKMKIVVGFSDISAIQSALYAKLGWPSIHGPMPATVFWPENCKREDVNSTAQILKHEKTSHSIIVDKLDLINYPNELTGKLFGGCFSVLTNLIGTQYFPKTLNDHILFLEDTGEPPGRLMRQWNQWIQGDVLRGVKAVVLGEFRDCTENEDDFNKLAVQFSQRCKLPVFISKDFGHTASNEPLMIGAFARIENNKLTWNFDFKPTAIGRV